MTSKTYAKNLNEFVKLLLLLFIIVIIQLSYTPIFAATLGDLNNDGEINVKDLVIVTNYIAELETLTEQQKELADVNRDGEVNIQDASLIQKYTLKIISSFTEISEETFIMPSLNGITLRDAENLIKDYGLVQGSITYQNHSSIIVDQIINQNPSAGTIVRKYDIVDLTISKGHAEKSVTTVYVAKTSIYYHRSDCHHMTEGKIPISPEKAKRHGFEACLECNPPQVSEYLEEEQVTPAEEPVTPAEEPVTPSTQRVFVGSKNSNIYHYPSCGHVQKILPGNLVTFSSAADAKSKGYVPCKTCKPPH